jgi:hypothetical protein
MENDSRPCDKVRFPVLVAVKMDRRTALALRRRAREEDRTVSSFVRRLLTEAVRKDSSDEQQRHGSPA